MDNRDYRADPLYRQKRRDNAAIWLGVVAVAVIAAFVFYGTTQRLTEPAVPEPMSQTALDNSAETNMPVEMAPEAVEPAEGDTFTNQVAPETPTPTESPAASVAPAAAPPSYASEADCKAATSAPCHYVTCDAVPEGKQPDEACGADFKKGWQPIAAAPDKTNVPEEVAPPLTGQGDAPVTGNPPLTGQ